MREVSRYSLTSSKIQKKTQICIASDLHNESYEDMLPIIAEADFLLVPGDIADRYRGGYDLGVRFLKDASKLVPVFFSIGNHELRLRDSDKALKLIRASGAVLLQNSWTEHDGLMLGGWYPSRKGRTDDFPSCTANETLFRLAMVHKPNLAVSVLERPVDLFVCGHAHGGQIRIGEQGIYAPGQGIFPKYTKGWYCGQRMLVTSGCGNPARAPRWGNPKEIVMLTLLPAKQENQ